MATETDPLASWGERAAKLVLWVVGPSALSGLAVGAYGWVTANPLYGVTFGFVAFAVIQLALTLQAIRRSATAKGPFADLGSDDAIAPQRTASQAAQLELELGELRSELRGTEQTIDKLKATIERLESENETLRRDAEAISDELPTARSENERLEAEIERLRDFEQGFAEQLAIATSLEADNER